MSRHTKYELVLFFEAVLYGIYGNWLIWYLSQVSFEDTAFLWLKLGDSVIGLVAAGWQFVLTIMVISCLLMMFLLLIFYPDRKRTIFLTSFFHTIGVFTTIAIEISIHPERFSYLTNFFLFGTLMLSFIGILEWERRKISRVIAKRDSENVLLDLQKRLEKLQSSVSHLETEMGKAECIEKEKLKNENQATDK